jgi:hypothetical protein
VCEREREIMFVEQTAEAASSLNNFFKYSVRDAIKQRAQKVEIEKKRIAPCYFSIQQLQC